MKEHILAALREQLEACEALLSGMSEAQAHTSLPGSEWRPKDVVAHLYAWQQRSVVRLEAALNGREPDYPQWLPGANPDTEADTDQVNTWIYDTYHDFPWAELHEMWREQYLRLVELCAQFNEPALLDSSRYAWMGGYSPADVLLGTYDHHQEHYHKLVE